VTLLFLMLITSCSWMEDQQWNERIVEEHKWSDVVCEHCKKDGLKSRVFVSSISTTLLHCPKGVACKKNTTYKKFLCSNNHVWVEENVE